MDIDNLINLVLLEKNFNIQILELDINICYKNHTHIGSISLKSDELLYNTTIPILLECPHDEPEDIMIFDDFFVKKNIYKLIKLLLEKCDRINFSHTYAIVILYNFYNLIDEKIQHITDFEKECKISTDITKNFSIKSYKPPLNSEKLLIFITNDVWDDDLFNEKENF